MSGARGQSLLSPVYVHAVLAMLAVGFAYQTWTRDRTQTQTDSVVVLDAAKKDVASLNYQDETKEITVEKRTGQDGEPYAWLVTKTKTKVPVPQPATASATGENKTSPTPNPQDAKATTPAENKPPTPAAAPTPAEKPAQPERPPEMKEVTTVKEYRGNDSAMELLNLFGPLKALRALGAVDDAKAKELGFVDSKKKLTVRAKGLEYNFVLGGTSYGGGDSYVRDGQGQVYLLSQRIAADFEFSDSRLMERKLHRFERADYDRIEVKVGEKTRVVVQGNRQNQQNFFFADGATPDKRDDTLKNWVEKLSRLAIGDYVARGEEPTADKAAVAMSGAPKSGEIMNAHFFDGKREIGSVVLFRYPNAKSNQPDFFAKTETTVGLVRLIASTADSVLQDAEKW
ncbi:MAG TPA: DUF4340 domain-containing protein [Pseudomonadota bacterium]|jgi:hypothetical protein|nr:DUF4340 domain-containing protein [Pseudomonadota bacterium]